MRTVLRRCSASKAVAGLASPGLDDIRGVERERQRGIPVRVAFGGRLAGLRRPGGLACGWGPASGGGCALTRTEPSQVCISHHFQRICKLDVNM